MNALSFQDARGTVLEKVLSLRAYPTVERLALSRAAGRVLALDALADRDYPPLDRSVRDGFAVRSSDLPGRLQVIGEVRAGEPSTASAGPGQAIEIMTGAPIPDGADAVVMVEHVTREGNTILTERTQAPGDFINRRGSESRQRTVVVPKGVVLTYPRIAMLAAIGMTGVTVYARPRVAILSTGDEVVDIAAAPLDYQVRNSNAWSLAAQVERAGGDPVVLPVARDEYNHTRALIEQGLTSDLLLLSGGVSAGKYDIVERVLADLGAGFYFDRVRIQPGQPLVFGRVRERFFFGLPGNPASTMVTFEVFARAALELIAGRSSSPLPFCYAPLTRDFRHKTGLTRFLPAELKENGLTPVAWQGSGDVAAMARANAYLVADADREAWTAGEMIAVLPQ